MRLSDARATIPSRVTFVVRAQALKLFAPSEATAGKPVSLTVDRFPSNRADLRYRFVIGEESPTAWSTGLAFTHVFARAGSYPVHAEVGNVTGPLQSSQVITIAVVPSRRWIYIVVAILALEASPLRYGRRSWKRSASGFGRHHQP